MMVIDRQMISTWAFFSLDLSVLPDPKKIKPGCAAAREDGRNGELPT
jgi:hypothetical protein